MYCPISEGLCHQAAGSRVSLALSKKIKFHLFPYSFLAVLAPPLLSRKSAGGLHAAAVCLPTLYLYSPTKPDIAASRLVLVGIVPGIKS